MHKMLVIFGRGKQYNHNILSSYLGLGNELGNETKERRCSLNDQLYFLLSAKLEGIAYIFFH